MIFTKDLQTTSPLNTYNNNIVEYKATDGAKTVVNSTIQVNGATYDLTPNLNNIFRFNFLKLAKALTNKVNFKDGIEFDLTADSVYEDVELYKEIQVDYTINFDDDTDEQITKTYKFTKSVQQIIRSTASVDDRLYPLISNLKLTYFEGYQYDIPIYSDIARTVTILNKRTGLDVDVDLLKGVNRWCVSDGQTNISIENILPLHLGVNELEFKIGAEIVFTIFLNKIDADCGKYVKWFNRQGSFSYWLFPNNTETSLNSKTISTLESDFEDLEDTQGNFLITGKNAGQSIKTLSQLLSSDERQYLIEILTSPKVEILNTERYSEVTLKDWVNVKVFDGTTTDLSRFNRQRLPIIIQLPNLYTQTL